MFDYDDEFNAGGYDGFGGTEDYNIWEENQIAGESEYDDYDDEDMFTRCRSCGTVTDNGVPMCDDCLEE